MKSFSIIIFGTGSIASRHGAILKKLGCHIQFVSRSKIKAHLNCNVLQYCEIRKYNPDYWLVCVPSSLHDKICKVIREFSDKKIFCEKPGPIQHIKNVKVLYNLRYLKGVKKLKEQYKKNSKIVLIHRVNAKKWKKNWKTSYVFMQSLGGGSVLTNSHELDIYQYISKKKINPSDVKITSVIKDIQNKKVIDYVKIKKNFLHIELSINSKEPFRSWEIKNKKKVNKIFFYGKNQKYQKKKIEEINNSYIKMWKSEFTNKSILPKSNQTKWICKLNNMIKI